MTAAIYRRSLADQRRSMLWWSFGAAAMVAMVAGSYSTIEGQEELDRSMSELPDAVQALFGVAEGVSFISPDGYLQSQLFSNVFPLVLTVLAIAVGARVLAGDESDGRLGVLLSLPISRKSLAWQRVMAAATVLLVVTSVSAVTLLASVATGSLSDGGPTVVQLLAATAGAASLAMLHGGVAFGVGAWTGRRGTALAVAGAVAAVGYLVQSLAQISETSRSLRWASPWYWFVDAAPLSSGAGDAVAPVLAAVGLAALLVAVGIARFARRDAG